MPEQSLLKPVETEVHLGVRAVSDTNTNVITITTKHRDEFIYLSDTTGARSGERYPVVA